MIAAVLASACGGSPTGVDGECRGSGGVVFAVSGEVASASGALADAEVEGCFRVVPSLATPGATTTTISDVHAFEIRVGGQTWSGDGGTIGQRAPENLRGGGLRVEASSDGGRLRVSAGRSPTSRPAGYLLFLSAPPHEDHTVFRVQDDEAPYAVLAEGTIEIRR